MHRHLGSVHGYGLVQQHAYGQLFLRDEWNGVWLDTSTVPCVDVYTDKWEHMCIGVWLEMCTRSWIDRKRMNGPVSRLNPRDTHGPNVCKGLWTSPWIGIVGNR